MKRFTFCSLMFALCLLSAGAAQAATIDFAPVGNPGNTADATGYGGVDYGYYIGIYEITNDQWREFLSAKAAVGDPHGLYNTFMGGAGVFGTWGGISRSGSGIEADPYVYSPKDGDYAWDDRPVNFVSLWDVARFCNWMHNGQGDADTETGSYANIGDPVNFTRLPGATVVIPTEDEWYKAAYYDAETAQYYDYPTGSDAAPTNENVPGSDLVNGSANYGNAVGTLTEVGGYYAKPSESPYGTYDQAGNVWEWTETAVSGTSLGLRGGSFGVSGDGSLRADYRDNYAEPTYENHGVGFRVVMIPEPSTAILLWVGVLGLLIGRRRRR